MSGTLIIAEQPAGAVVSITQPEAAVVSAGLRGRQGPPGVGAGGVTYTQDSEPSFPDNKATWYNPLTLQLKVYVIDEWKSVAPDGGYF